MKVVIQCSGKKAPGASTFTHEGRVVTFIAHPELYRGKPAPGALLCRPDDAIPNRTTTWRQHLVAYNDAVENPDRLLPAGRLYSRSAYEHLLGHVGAENFFILSAGWGLVRSDFLLPDYDITFMSSAGRWLRRSMKRDDFHDFNYLHPADVDAEETVYFFGGLDYLPLYYDLTKRLRCRKVIYTAAASVPTEEEYEYIDYGKNYTNWQYGCATDFIADRIPR